METVIRELDNNWTLIQQDNLFVVLNNEKGKRIVFSCQQKATNYMLSEFYQEIEVKNVELLNLLSK